MSQRIKCPRCGRLHSAQSLDGACPEYLVRISLGDDSAREEPPKEHGIVPAEVLPPEEEI